MLSDSSGSGIFGPILRSFGAVHAGDPNLVCGGPEFAKRGRVRIQSRRPSLPILCCPFAACFESGLNCALTPTRTAPSASPALAMSLQCPDCEQTFKSAATRSHHRWSQHSKIPPIVVANKKYAVEWEDDKLRCPVDQCGRSYTSREGFAKHAKAAHRIKNEPSMQPPPPTGLSQRTIPGQRLSFSLSGGESDVLLHSLNT